MIEKLSDILDVAFTIPGGHSVSIGQLVSVVLLVVIGYWASRFVGYVLGRRLEKSTLRPDAIYTLKRITFFAFLLLVFITALGLLGIPLAAFAFATGAIAIGVGFGAQNIINNFISGWILMAERPIRINDFIEFDSGQGTVERIGNRSTRIRRTDGVHVLVPNSQLLERSVINWTLVDLHIRTIVRVGVEYGSPVRQVEELILKAVAEQPEVNAEPPPSVIFEDFGDSALIFDAYFWCDASGERLLRKIRSDIRFRITDLFEEAGIVISFPQRDVHLDTMEPLDIRILEDKGTSSSEGDGR